MDAKEDKVALLPCPMKPEKTMLMRGVPLGDQLVIQRKIEVERESERCCGVSRSSRKNFGLDGGGVVKEFISLVATRPNVDASQRLDLQHLKSGERKAGIARE